MPKKLLLVDDEEDLREILAFTLVRRGFEVLQASNGSEAFDLVLKNDFDLIISDIQMPGGNGIKLLEDVRNHHFELPVVLFITGFADITLEEAYDKGAEAIFAKPFNVNHLVEAIQKALTPKDVRLQPRAEREPMEANVELKLEGIDQVRTAKILNIGRGGIFVSMNDNFPRLNSNVSFKIELSEGTLTLIEGTGTVKWIRQEEKENLPRGCGIEFIELTDNARAKIITFINYLKTKQYIPRN